MELSTTQITALFENFKNTQNQQPLHIKISKFLQELKIFIQEEPPKPQIDLSEEILSFFFKRFIESDQTGKIQRSENPPDLIFWNALGFGKDEVKNCRILSWLLDPNADHCQGNSFFACLLQIKHLKQYFDFARQRIYVSREEWLDETNRADIIIHGDDFNIVIEAKIMASERENQRVDYRARMMKCYPGKRFIGIFLVSKINHSEEDSWISITWKDISDAIKIFSSAENVYRCNNSFVRELASQYGKYIDNFIY